MEQTLLVVFKFGQITPWSQTTSSIVITRKNNRILELPELKEHILASKEREHKYYSPDTDLLAILSTSVTKETANLSEF